MTDVVILGGGLAGLSLARHLLLETDLRVALLERRRELPPRRQKVGESTVQLAGYYFSKVLDLEEHLVTEQLMKYNLRFYWPTADADGSRCENYAQSYIRDFSNVASYQLDRNRFEAHLLELNRRDERFRLELGISRLAVELAVDGAPHRLRYRAGGRDRRLAARWVIDATGRGRALAKRLGLRRDNAIRHGSVYWWVEGLVDVEKLTDLEPRAARLHPGRRQTGHLPSWMATNHFMTEGAWFWVIPLRGRTSLGLVYDPRVVAPEEVASVDAATRWVCERFPLFARDLPRRAVVGRGGLRDFSYDCARTLSSERWAMTGESGRFSDPLYSPGSDLIAVHNTLIVDAVRGDLGARDARPVESLASKCAAYEQLMRATYSAYEASYLDSYDVLGDQEAQALKYAWELAVYFSFYVFPFVNELFVERRFRVAYLRAFARLGPLNRSLQKLLSAFFQWKKSHGGVGAATSTRFDFTSIVPLARARDTFFAVGLPVSESRRVLAGQLDNLEELARFVVAWVAARAVDDPRALHHRRFVDQLDPRRATFEPLRWRRLWAEVQSETGSYGWSFDVDRVTIPGAPPVPGEGSAAGGRERPTELCEAVG